MTKYKIVSGEKDSTYEGGKYMYRIYYLSSADQDGTWKYHGHIIATSIEAAKTKFIASLPEKELIFYA